MKKIKVMVIAPYEGLKESVMALAPVYRDKLDITVTLGDLSSGALAAKDAERMGYDLVISRGGTAEMIGNNVSIPVINIDISGYDYMRAIKLAENIHGPKAFVGFSYITERARSVNNLLQTDVDIFTVYNQDEIAPLLKKLTGQGYELIIGDVATCREAKELDINNLLLISGEESIIDAFESAIAWTGAYSNRIEQLHLLQQVVAHGREHVIVLNEKSQVIYESASLSQLGLSLEELDELSRDESLLSGREIILQQENGVAYVMLQQLDPQEGGGNRAFYIRSVPAGEHYVKEGISVRNFRTEPANKDFFRQNSMHDQNIIDVARSFCHSRRPVLLSGDPGVGKAEMAAAIHRYSEHWMCPFILVDCTVVSLPELIRWLDKSAQLMQGGATVCFENLDASDRKTQRQLSTLLQSMNPENWRFIATARSGIQQMVEEGKFDEQLYRFFSQLSLYIPNLNQSRHNLEKIVNLYIIEANSRLGRQVIGVDEEGRKLIWEHTWHYNYDELQQAIYQMVLIAQGPFITAQEVRTTVLAREPLPGENGLPLVGTLEEIELKIIRRVLEEENGNLSRTSERLNIGRSTLWRKLKG